MDLTDLTIAPMIPGGIAMTVATVKIFTGWGWLASVEVGVIPGALLGFLAGLLLYIASAWTLERVSRTMKRPKTNQDRPE